MPGPMSIPNRRGHDTYKVVVDHDKHGNPIFAHLPLSALTGEQRIDVARRGLLVTGKTARTHNKEVPHVLDT